MEIKERGQWALSLFWSPKTRVIVKEMGCQITYCLDSENQLYFPNPGILFFHAGFSAL